MRASERLGRNKRYTPYKEDEECRIEFHVKGGAVPHISFQDSKYNKIVQEKERVEGNKKSFPCLCGKDLKVFYLS
jgi:hypothetical protein